MARGFSPGSLGSTASGSEGKPHSMAEGLVQHSCPPPGSQEAETGRGKGQGMSPRRTPRTHSLQPGPSS